MDRLKQLAILEEAKLEAERFIKRANEAIVEIADNHNKAQKWLQDNESYYNESNKANAAAKRSSMDLTRALVKVRRG